MVAGYIACYVIQGDGSGDEIEIYTYFDAATVFAVELPSIWEPTEHATNGCMMQYTFIGGFALQFAIKE